MTQTQPTGAIDSLERLGITTPGEHPIFCPFCEQDKKKCSVAVKWRPGVPHKPEFLSGTFHCWKCEGKGSVRRGFLYPARGMSAEGFGVAKVESSVKPEDAPLEYVRCYHAAWKIYQSLYPGSPGEAYLASRGFMASDIPAGWAPPGVSTLLEAGLAKGVLTDLHLINGKGQDTLGSGGGRVILPFSWRGRIVTLYGRALTPGTMLPHFYTRAKVTTEDGNDRARWRRGAFGDRQLDQELVILTEAPLDALALRSLGVPNVCALGGTANDIVLERISPTATVGLAFDNDPEKTSNVKQLDQTIKVIKRSAGNDAARRLQDKLGGDRTFRIIPPPLPSGEAVKDWAEYLQRTNDLKIEPQLPRDLEEAIRQYNLKAAGSEIESISISA